MAKKILGKINGFWDNLSLWKKRLTIIVGICTAIGFFAKCGWAAFVTINDLENRLALVDTLQAKLERHTKYDNLKINDISRTAIHDDSLVSVIINRNANCWSTILYPYMGRLDNHGKQILIDKNNLEYFYNNNDGIIYTVYQDNAGTLYYYNNNNQRIICR